MAYELESIKCFLGREEFEESRSGRREPGGSFSLLAGLVRAGRSGRNAASHVVVGNRAC